MANKKEANNKKTTVTHQFRVSFPSVFEAKAFEDQKAKYSVTMIFPKNVDLGKPADKQQYSLKAIVLNAAKEKWGPDKAEWPKKLKMPFRDGDEDRPDVEGYADSIFAVATSDTKPGLIDRKKQDITSEEDFYAGCYARAQVKAFAYDTKGNRGVGLALQNIQKIKDGEHLGGKRAARDVFDAIESDEDDDFDSDDEDDDFGF